jgi:hypothetical protein
MMRKVVGRVGVGGANVGRGEVRAVVGDVLNAVARSEAAPNVLNGDALPRITGFPIMAFASRPMPRCCMVRLLALTAYHT